MKINELLFERVVNAFDNHTKHKYADQVWDILQTSYNKLPGGFASASSVDELIADSGLWKLIKRGDKITAVGIYKDRFGRKSIASGTDGTAQGRNDYMMIKQEDVVFHRAWAEVSGAPKKIMIKLGAKPIPAKFANVLTGKKILEVDPDGFHYTRLIAGHPHEKIIYGTVNVTEELKELLSNSGIELHELPDNFIQTS